jgi:hypothetical protein
LDYHALKGGKSGSSPKFHSNQEQVGRLCGLAPSTNCILVITWAVRSLTKVETRLLPQNLGEVVSPRSHPMEVFEDSTIFTEWKMLASR